MNRVNRNTKRNNHNYAYDSSFYAYGYAYNRQCKTEICFSQLNEVVCRSKDYLRTYSTLGTETCLRTGSMYLFPKL